MVQYNRTTVFANCWYLSEYEAKGMWTQYAGEHASIALRTTFSKLRAVLPENVELGLMRYIDYAKERIPHDNILNYYMYKRKEYEGEREVRALLWSVEIKSGTKQPYVTVAENQRGLLVPMELGEAIETVVVAPGSPEWLQELIVAMIARYGLEIDVVRSDLERLPTL